MNIEIGDTVQALNKPSRLFGALNVIDIIGVNAICRYYLLDKDIDGDERPASMIETESSFPLEELTLVNKRNA